MRRFLPLFLALMLALAPAFAGARPGLGSSFGSRGSATWSSPAGTASAPGGAMGFSRSATPNYGYGSYGGYGYGGYHRPMFGGGMLGGFLGGGLLGLALGGGFFGFHGGFGFLGVLLQLALLFFVGRWLWRNMMGAPAMAGGGGGFARGLFPQPGLAAGGGGYGRGGPARQLLALSQPDYQQFSQLLTGIQAAWSRGDLAGLQSMATPEMVGYFNEQLSDLASRGLRNEVRDVHLLQGDLSEGWSEGGRDYATVSLRFSIIDVTYDRAGHVVDGSPTERVTVTEFWTFVRSLPGHWILSAIQQAR